MTAAAGTTATVSGAVTVSVANSIAGANNVTAAFTNGITDSLANLASDGNAAGGLSTAAGDDTNVNITISDDSTSMAAADLSAVTGSTAGTVTLSNSQTITGTGAQVKAALVTDAVTAAAGTTATVNSGAAISATDASAIATANNVTAAFSTGISDSLANLLNDDQTAVSTELGNADGDDADVNITITDDSTSITAAKLSLITAATDRNSHIIEFSYNHR